MNPLIPKLTPFLRRVRLVRSVQGMFFGLFIGGLLCLAWVVLDMSRVLYADWKGLGALAGSSALIGAIAGAFRKTSVESLASSMDGRAGLKDRLGTATENRAHESGFDSLIQVDAANSIEGLVPAKVYPIRFGRANAAAIATLVVAATAFLLGNSPLLRGPKTASERRELHEMGEAVKRVLKPLEKPVTGVPIPEGRKNLASDLNRFARELEEGRINKEEALRKANELAKKAEDSVKENADKAQSSLDQAETAMSKYVKMQLNEQDVSSSDFERLKLSASEQRALDEAMKDQGFENPKSEFSEKQLGELGIDRNAERLAQMSPEQREQLRNAISQRQQELQKELDRMDKLSESERKALEKQMQEMRQQQKDLQKLSESLKLSEDALKTLREVMQSKEMKEIREAMQKMQQKSQQMGQQGKPPTKEEIEEMRQKLEALAKQLKDPEFRKQYLEAMKKALQDMEEGQASQQAMQQMMQSMGLSLDQGSSQEGGDPGSSDDNAFADTGMVNKSEHEMETKGKTLSTGVKGEWNDDKGEQWSVTVKAPTQVGNRSSVPYQSVLPQYRHAAEKALSGGRIPKGQEKRVKEYFDSLTGGKSK